MASFALDIMAEAVHAAREADTTRENKYKQIMGLKTVHLLSFFALVYVGVEVTLGGKEHRTIFRFPSGLNEYLIGWIVTFIEQKRAGSSSSGYISSGFFGGEFYLFISW